MEPAVAGGLGRPRVDFARELMVGFAERTGLTSERPPRRYLWTDAFAVGNLLGLARATGEARYAELAMRLIDQVHRTLGRHRGDDGRSGWLSGLGEEEGEDHPTRAGLRIGKPLPERGADEPANPHLEWDRDGQYFHYLTRWMYALDLASRERQDRWLHRLAVELAQAAHRAFVHVPLGARRPRMVWKMSIDLSRPQVASMGQHDPLDGFLTCVQIQDTGRALGAKAGEPELVEEIASFAAMIERDLATADPLGIGGLLLDASRIHQLLLRDAVAPVPAAASIHAGLLHHVLAAALAGLELVAVRGDLAGPASARLAFRELGLSIGLAATASRFQPVARYAPLRRIIESFWLDPAHRQAATWTEHQDINEVMLATSLAPGGFATLQAARSDRESSRFSS
jgi:hypothetical protein